MHNKNCTDIFEGPIKILRTQVFIVTYVRWQPQAQVFCLGPTVTVTILAFLTIVVGVLKSRTGWAPTRPPFWDGVQYNKESGALNASMATGSSVNDFCFTMVW